MREKNKTSFRTRVSVTDDINCRAFISLHQAIIYRKKYTWSTMLHSIRGDSSKADIDEEGNTCLHCAVGFGEFRVAEGLIQLSPVEETLVRNNYGFTSLHLAIMRTSFSVKLIDQLLAKGVDINIKDDKGNSSLHLAIQFSNLEALNALINHGADLSITNNEGKSPLEVAKEFNQVDHIKSLESNIKLLSNSGEGCAASTDVEVLGKSLTSAINPDPEESIKPPNEELQEISQELVGEVVVYMPGASSTSSE